MELKLKKLSAGDGQDIYQMLQDIPSEENGFYNNAHGLTFDEFKDWLTSQAVALANGGVIAEKTDDSVLIWVNTTNT